MEINVRAAFGYNFAGGIDPAARQDMGAILPMGEADVAMDFSLAGKVLLRLEAVLLACQDDGGLFRFFPLRLDGRLGVEASPYRHGRYHDDCE